MHIIIFNLWTDSYCMIAVSNWSCVPKFINLEDIAAPACFTIEDTLKERLDIPVFHDDQHGTAVICAAGLINALHLSGKKIEDVRIVLNGAGAAGIACIELLKSMGARHENCIVCDTKGVIYQGRTEGMNQWKSAHAVKTDLRTLTEAMKDADVFLGVSVKGAVTVDMVKAMAPDAPVNANGVLVTPPSLIVKD